MGLKKHRRTLVTRIQRIDETDSQYTSRVCLTYKDDPVLLEHLLKLRKPRVKKSILKKTKQEKVKYCEEMFDTKRKTIVDTKQLLDFLVFDCANNPEFTPNKTVRFDENTNRRQLEFTMREECRKERR